MFFGGLDRGSAVQGFPEMEVELARVAPLRQWSGDGLALRHTPTRIRVVDAMSPM